MKTTPEERKILVAHSERKQHRAPLEHYFAYWEEEDDEFRHTTWVAAVISRETKQGYWQWVANKHEEKEWQK